MVDTNTDLYPLEDKARNVNRWYYKVVSWIWKASQKWEFDDSNHADLPIATTDLVDEQQDYELPSTLLKLIGISVKDDNGDWYKLDPIDRTEIPKDREEFLKTPGRPRFYDLVGNSIFLYPKPDTNQVTLSGGLKVYLARKIDAFTASDTDQEPGFAENFHRILSLGAAYDWAIAKGLNIAKTLRQEIEQLKQELFDFYGNRNLEDPPRIMPRRERLY